MFGLEIRKPSKQTVVGFLVTWGVAIAIVLLTLLLAQIGA